MKMKNYSISYCIVFERVISFLIEDCVIKDEIINEVVLTENCINI